MELRQYSPVWKGQEIQDNKAGTNWYMADRTMEYMLDDLRKITLKIITPDNRYYDEVIDISEILSGKE